MEIFQFVLILTTLLCSIVAGFLFAFAVVIMPGIKNLDDGAFLGAFRAMDGVIQNSQPLFMVVWVGSLVLSVLAAVLGLFYLDGAGCLLLILSSLIYICGVQLPTMVFNIPLNNMVQSLDPDSMDQKALKAARGDFEPRWNRWNRIRTVLSILASSLLLVLVFTV